MWQPVWTGVSKGVLAYLWLILGEGVALDYQYSSPHGFKARRLSWQDGFLEKFTCFLASVFCQLFLIPFRIAEQARLFTSTWALIMIEVGFGNKSGVNLPRIPLSSFSLSITLRDSTSRLAACDTSSVTVNPRSLSCFFYPQCISTGVKSQNVHHPKLAYSEGSGWRRTLGVDCQGRSAMSARLTYFLLCGRPSRLRRTVRILSLFVWVDHSRKRWTVFGLVCTHVTTPGAVEPVHRHLEF